tara:strand:- start:286 stop:1203 length:918 start_codon:yes stop_codon:yes gene_type:complete
MNLLISGGTGFLGKYIYRHWKSNGYSVDSVGRGNSNEIVCDISKDELILKKDYEYFIHCAGKAHTIPKTNIEVNEFYLVNEIGTVSFLNAINQQKNKPKGVLIISTVAVYGLTEGTLINEKASLTAKDAYGKSKINAEKIAIDWGKNNNINISVLRLPLVVGKNAPGNLLAMINGIKNGKYLNIGGGKAKKSMVLATDVASFSSKVINTSGIYNLTDTKHPNFFQISNVIANNFKVKNVLNIPMFVAQILVFFIKIINIFLKTKIPFTIMTLKKMTNDLTFDDKKAQEIGWKPSCIINNGHEWLK